MNIRFITMHVIMACDCVLALSKTILKSTLARSPATYEWKGGRRVFLSIPSFLGGRKTKIIISNDFMAETVLRQPSP